MKKILDKKIIIGMMIGLVLSVGGVYAANTCLATDIKYKETTVNAALDDLYIKQENNQVDYMGTVDGTSSTGSGASSISPFKEDAQKINDIIQEGYGFSSKGWHSSDNQENSWIQYSYSKPVKITKVKVAHGISPNNTYVKEATVTVQASNDYFKNEIITLGTITLKYDQEILEKGYYAVKGETTFNNDKSYKSYRIYSSGKIGWTGGNKMQLSYIRFFK